MNNIQKSLTKAREAITLPKNWLKGFMAKTVMDRRTNGFDMAACKFCALGAIDHGICETIGYLPSTVTSDLRKSCQRSIYAKIDNSSIAHWNDFLTTHEGVLAVFDAAINDAAS